jgi:hypothetical protein
MTKATEGTLGALHALVATALTARLNEPLRKGDDLVPVPGTEGMGCSSSDIQAAIAFLKNNNITADPETNSELADLNKALAARRKDRKQAMLSQQAAADDFEQRLGGMQ